MIKRTMAAIAVASLLGSASTAAWSAPKDIRWATGPVGSSGDKALVALASVLNKAMPELRISVLPTPGAVTTVKGFATGDFDGYYGSDVALKELKADDGRFKGFKAHITQQPIQSLWCYTLDVGLAIKASDRDSIRKWEDLSGKAVYTGPLPFDTRRQLENAMAAVGVHHIYKQVDLSTAGSQLNSGSIRGMSIYAAGGKTPPPWIAEATLAVDWAALNPSPDELKKLKAAGFSIEQVDPANFHKKELYVKKVTLLPFYWGFDLGHDRLGGRDVQDADRDRGARGRAGQARPELPPDQRRPHGRVPEASAGVDLESRAHPSRPREIHEGKGRVGKQVGYQRREVTAAG